MAYGGLVLALLAPVTGLTSARAATVDPLPPVAQALSHVTSYQVSITPQLPGGQRPTRPRTGTGRRQRPPQGTGGGFGFGFGDQTLTAVRKGQAFEDYFVIHSRTSSKVLGEAIVYGTKVCQRAAGARSYTCATASSTGPVRFTDPTVDFESGAGSTTFNTAGSKTNGGEVCDGYTYRSPDGSYSGTVYISSQTHLPCEQIATMKVSFNGRSFTRTSTYVWSHFNDPHLSVPPVP